eukprot:Rmarinus@m.23602
MIEEDGGPFSTISIVYVSVLCVVFGSMAAGTGLGGGGFYVPIITFLLSTIEEAKDAMPLSKAAILGVAIGNYIVLSQEKHRDGIRPRIDYDFATFMMPCLLIGTVVGVIINILLPNVVIVVFLGIILSFVTWKTFRKGVSIYHQVKRGPDPIEIGMVDRSSDALPEGSTQFVEAEAANTSHVRELVVVFSLAVLVDGCSIISTLVIGRCSVTGWGVQLLPVPILFAYLLYDVRRKIAIQTERRGQGMVHRPDSVIWTTKSASLVPAAALTAGLVAGSVGLGGGMVMTPLMLHVGIDSLTATATSSFLMLFTASGSTIHFFLEDRLPVDYWIWFTFLGFMASQLGQHWIKRYFGRQAYRVIFLLTGVLCASALGIAAVAVKEVVDEAASAKGVFEFDTGYFRCETE